jgi:hypothetical protein
MLYCPPTMPAEVVVIIERLLGKQPERERGLNYYCLAVGAPYSTFDVPHHGTALASMVRQTGAQYHLFDEVAAKDNLEALLSEIEGLCNNIGVGEHDATPVARDRAKDLIETVRPLVAEADIPLAELDCYYGELGVEWQKDNRILRLTSFNDPNTPIRLDYGTMSVESPGEYRSDPVADTQILADRLVWLSSDNTKTVAA